MKYVELRSELRDLPHVSRAIITNGGEYPYITIRVHLEGVIDFDELEKKVMNVCTEFGFNPKYVDFEGV